jgi:hypothetical protein
MTLNIKGIVDRYVCLEEALCRGSRLETLHLALAPADGEMRILSAVVVAQSGWPVPVDEAEDLQRGRVGAQAVGCDGLRLNMLTTDGKRCLYRKSGS